jgi:hypothetical protein
MQKGKYSLEIKASRAQLIQKPGGPVLAKTSGWPIATVSHGPIATATLYLSSIADNQYKASTVLGQFHQIV